MDLKLPIVISPLGGRLVEAWVPAFWPALHKVGPSFSALRDELALAVMERFEKEAASAVAAYQLPPHMALRHVKVNIEERDREKNRRVVLEGRMAVLLEKWPRDDFWVVTPTRLPEARFALAHPDALPQALARRMAAWCLERDIETLDKEWTGWAQGRERLELLEVDAYAPTILPRTPPKPPAPPRRRKSSEKKEEKEPPETPEQREARRNRRRLSLVELREVARNLSHGARDDALERCYGREALVREVVDALEGREGAALVLVGPPGSGKTALVHEVVRRLTARQDAAGTRRDVWRVDGNQFIAGMMFVGQWEARAREVVQELKEVGDLLYVDDLASLVYAGRTSNERTNVAQYIEPHLARGELTVLAESTPERFERVRELAPTFASLFRVVHVPALDARGTLPALLGTLRELEAASGAGAVRLSPLALETLLDLQQRFVAHEAFPGKAVRLLRRVVARPGTKDDDGVRRFTAGDVTAAMREQTGLPDFVLGSAPPKTRETLERELAAQVAGQPEAVSSVVDAILTLQRSLQPPDKPLATYLFVGPTGVGKTETAKALARTLFGSEGRLVRFDMSEFVSAASITRLLGQPGAPDGELTTALRTQPFCVVLFDEVEKAHPRIFDALLQFLGEGRLTDGAGRTVDARQAVVVLTSNLGVREAAARTGFHRTAESAEAHYLSAVRAFFRPEFFNRLDRVVPFRPLTPAALRVVVEHALESLLSRRGIRRGNVLVEVESQLLDLLVEQAYDPRYGARPLKRALERRLTVPLAHHLIRRGAEDLARVELFRRGDDMGLSVELMVREPAWAPEPDPAGWTLGEVSRVLEATAIRLETLSAREAARPSGTDLHPEAVELVERLGRLSVEAVDIRENELAERDFLEREVPVTKALAHGYDWSRNIGRGGLRARPGYAAVPLPVSPEERLRRCRPRVVALRDEVEWLAHQLACRERGPDVCAVLMEGLGDAPVSALDAVARALPQDLGRAVVHEERVEPDGRVAWARLTSERPAGVRVRRIVVGLTGFGLAEVLAPLEGYALVEAAHGDIVRPAPVRVELLKGDADLLDDVPRAVVARDAVRLAEREARRAGTAPEQGSGRVVMEGRESEVAHLASRRPPSQALAWAGRVLRHAAREEG
ncbi:ATP-dependent Clp protease ATP-binding subunit [Pyxidicoccus fallax]|uniref:ATP-dependent Clp protease ATP-binding subunit n=1 Tax=Pyxidicoccus fallax TaxID=394095 RepID=A0A848LD13_9BACT|nr:AAA family ATPase [Pyxidicoccus fallax]NMO16577.1 ATP-dependent Clp protease ATP-binding subunit [Pyxidicoccus fallax]NPC84547.1 ATP-dependent Clp protease ATP-binding subunit [Pyxidicoccus fallax]